MARAKIIINQDECIGCKRCVNACNVDALRLNEETKKAEAKYIDECEFCLICEEQCPKQCIRVEPIMPIYLPNPYGNG